MSDPADAAAAAPHPAELSPALRFLSGGGRCARLILARDWAGHRLGPPEAWPEPLKTALSLVLNSPESMILAWDPDELSFFFNDAYIPLLGPRLDWAMGERFDRVWADGWAQARPIIADAFAGRSVRYVDLPWKLDTDRGAADTWWTFSYSRVLDAGGGIAGLFIFTNETTDKVLAARRRDQAERTLAAERGMAQQVLDNIGEAFALLDRDLRILDMNAVALQMEGRPREAVVGLTHQEAHPAADPELARSFLQALADQAPVSLEHRYEWDDGRVTWIEMRAYPVDDKLAVFYRDVSARKRAEAQLRDLNETLERRVAEEVAKHARTEEALRQAQKMEAVGQLTGGIAHDFNNLLAGISGSLEMMERRLNQGRTQDLGRYMAPARDAAMRAAALTHRLLAFARRQTLAPKPTDVNRLVEGMEDLIRRTVGPQVALHRVAAPDLWIVKVDPPQLENALLNLCINARDAMSGSGRIVVETANIWLDDASARERGLPAGQYVTLGVADTGCGMPPEVLERIFEPFFTTKPVGQGTGLGLSMIYGFAQQSGGQIRVRSRVGSGTTLTLYLPRHMEGLASDFQESDAVELARALESETVLVVDDEPTVRMLMAEVLEDLGYTTFQAADGPSGLKFLRSGMRIDLLVTDVGLPGGLSGRQVAEAARVDRPGLRVLFVTGYAEEHVLDAERLEPGMHLLTKPFTIEAFAAGVKKALAPTGH